MIFRISSKQPDLIKNSKTFYNYKRLNKKKMWGVPHTSGKPKGKAFSEIKKQQRNCCFTLRNAGEYFFYYLL